MTKELSKEQVENIHKLIETTEKNLRRLKEALKQVETVDKRDLYKDVPGVMGMFDGVGLIAEDGQKMEVPSNYAAKSRLVYGDVLKLIEEDGKQVYKQIEKVERKKVSGILTKKEGKWHIISDLGTYKISDIAAEYQHAELNDEAIAFVPVANLNTPYAALDSIKKRTTPLTVPSAHDAAPKKEDRPAARKTEGAKRSSESSTKPARARAPRNAAPAAPAAPKKPFEANYKPPKKEFVESLGGDTKTYPVPENKRLDEDDLR